MEILLANSVDPDQMPHSVASDLGLHCLPMTLLWFPGKKMLREPPMKKIHVNRTSMHSVFPPYRG